VTTSIELITESAILPKEHLPAVMATVRGDNLDAVVSSVLDSGAAHLGLTVYGRSVQMSVLAKLSQLRSLTLGGVGVTKDDFVEGLVHLQLLHLHTECRNKIDLSRHIDLRNLVCRRAQRVGGLTNLSRLSSLEAWSLQGPTMAELEPPPALNSLKLIQPNIVDLDGIQRFVDLEALDISLAKKLTYIDTIASLRSLRALRIQACAKVADFQAIGAVRTLESLDFVDAGETLPLGFLEELPRLKSIRVVGRSAFLSNDISQLLRLPCLERVDVRWLKRYDMSEVAFQSKLAHRR